jgi:hypothetical protein
MVDLHLYSKFSATAASIIQSDPNFKTLIETAISIKDLKRTLNYLIKKAKTVQSQLNFTDSDIPEVAYELFINIIETSSMDDERKTKMARTINKKLTNPLGDEAAATPSVVSTPAAPSVSSVPRVSSSPRPKIFSSASSEPPTKPSISPSIPRISTPRSSISPPNIPKPTPKPRISTPRPSIPSPSAKTPTPSPSIKNEVSAPAKGGKYSLYWDSVGVMAYQLVQTDLDFVGLLKTAVSSKKLKETLSYLMNKALSVKEENNYTDEEVGQLAFEIGVMVFDDMPIPEEKKAKMIKTINRKIAQAFAISPELSQKPPEQNSNPIEKGPKIFSSSTLTGESETQPEAPLDIQPKGAAKGPGANVAEGVPSTPATDNVLKNQRAAIRAKRTAKKKPLPALKGKEGENVFDPFPILDKWLRGDHKFIKMVDHFKKTGPRGMKIIFDPDSEGYISYVDINIATEIYGTHNIIKLICISDAGKKYPYNMAIGYSGKRWVATSLDDEIPKNIDDTVEQLARVNMKNQLEWDRLMVILNNSDIVKKVKKLQLKNPAPNSGTVPIRVPIYIKKDIPTNKIILTTYVAPNLKPSLIFLDLIEGIAEACDRLGGDDDGEIAGSLGVKFAQLSNRAPVQDMSGYDFKYLEKDEAVSFKSCPYCGKPYPNPEADYRRCPHCLAKLK